MHSLRQILHLGSAARTSIGVAALAAAGVCYIGPARTEDRGHMAEGDHQQAGGIAQLEATLGAAAHAIADNVKKGGQAAVEEMEGMTAAVSHQGERLSKMAAGGDKQDAGTAQPQRMSTAGSQASKPEDIPGESKHIGSRLLGAAEGALQHFAPIKGIHQHVCAWHFYAHDMGRQVVAHHYCSHVNEEMRQCVIYDSDKPGARLIGIEYIISRRLFEGLPDDEKKYWHSHKYEVQSGEIIAPHVPEAAERIEMQSLTDTYGKTWHTWQYDRGDTLPLGPPQLMMAFTADGQIDTKLIDQRDREYGVSTEKRRESRANLSYPERTDPAADHWQQSGEAWQVQMVKQPQTPSPSTPSSAQR